MRIEYDISASALFSSEFSVSFLKITSACGVEGEL